MVVEEEEEEGRGVSRVFLFFNLPGILQLTGFSFFFFGL